MSLYLGKQKLQVPKASSVKESKIPKAFFDGGGNFRYLTATSIDGWFLYSDTADVTSMSSMFYNCRSLTSVPNFDTSKVTDMRTMFQSCTSLTSVPLFDTSNVTDMSYMFSSCSSLTSVPLFDTSKVTNMSYMFYNCSSLTSVPAFDTSKVTNMSYMFSSCSSLTAIHMTGMKVSFDISASTKFAEEALVEIIGNLASVTTTQTLTMGSTNLAKLTDDEKAVATGKGWTLK